MLSLRKTIDSILHPLRYMQCLIMSHRESKNLLKERSSAIEYKDSFLERRSEFHRGEQKTQKSSYSKAGKTKNNHFD